MRSPGERERVLQEVARLFNDKLYFECHDLLEYAWSETRGEERSFLHALIQVAVGMVHVANANHQGAVNLLSRGIEALASFAPERDGLDVDALLGDVAVCLKKSQQALEGEPADWRAEDVPILRFVAVE